MDTVLFALCLTIFTIGVFIMLGPTNTDIQLIFGSVMFVVIISTFIAMEVWARLSEPEPIWVTWPQYYFKLLFGSYLQVLPLYSKAIAVVVIFILLINLTGILNIFNASASVGVRVRPMPQAVVPRQQQRVLRRQEVATAEQQRQVVFDARAAAARAPSPPRVVEAALDTVSETEVLVRRREVFRGGGDTYGPERPRVQRRKSRSERNKGMLARGRIRVQTPAKEDEIRPVSRPYYYEYSTKGSEQRPPANATDVRAEESMQAQAEVQATQARAETQSNNIFSEQNYRYEWVPMVVETMEGEGEKEESSYFSFGGSVQGGIEGHARLQAPKMPSITGSVDVDYEPTFVERSFRGVTEAASDYFSGRLHTQWTFCSMLIVILDFFAIFNLIIAFAHWYWLRAVDPVLIGFAFAATIFIFLCFFKRRQYQCTQQSRRLEDLYIRVTDPRTQAS